MSNTASPSRKSVVVVGGGLAGIAAALALAKHGVAVTLMESRRCLGGRAGSFVVQDAHGIETETVDYCQHVGMGCCTNLWQLISWLGHEQLWQRHRELHFFGPTGRYRKLSALPLPAPFHLAGWLAKWPGLTFNDRVSIARGMRAIGKLNLHGGHERQAAHEWLIANGQTPTAIQNFWQTILVSALGEELERVSLGAVVKVLQDGFLNHRSAFHLLVPTRPLNELFGSRAQQRLGEAGVDVQLRTAVDTISTLGQHPTVVSATGREFQADAVVSAIPWHQYRKVEIATGNATLQRIARQAPLLDSSPISGVHTWWDRRWFHQPHATIVGRLCQWVFPKQESPAGTESTMAEAEQSFYCQIVISASRSLAGQNSEAVAALIHDDLSQVFPEVRQAKLLRCKAVTDPQAVFSIAPNALEYRPLPALSDNVIVAGDWTRTGWPATMEGAILSGFRAAEILLEQWGHPTQIACGALRRKTTRANRLPLAVF
jgi:squalene-associated FAD-dependent desaturase